MRILVVEDMPERIKVFRSFFVEHTLDVIATSDGAIKLLKENEYDAIYLDHDLDDDHYSVGIGAPAARGTGQEVATFLANNPDNNWDAYIIIHSLNPVGSVRMLETLQDGKRRVKRVPFGTNVFAAVV